MLDVTGKSDRSMYKRNAGPFEKSKSKTLMNQIRLQAVSLGGINAFFKMKKQVTVLYQHLLKASTPKIHPNQSRKRSRKKALSQSIY